MDPQEEIIRLLALQVRLETENQTEAIRELTKAGFGPARIAELLGTTPGTVGVALAKMRRRAGKSGKTGDSGDDAGSPGKRAGDGSAGRGST